MHLNQNQIDDLRKKVTNYLFSRRKVSRRGVPFRNLFRNVNPYSLNEVDYQSALKTLVSDGILIANNVRITSTRELTTYTLSPDTFTQIERRAKIRSTVSSTIPQVGIPVLSGILGILLFRLLTIWGIVNEDKPKAKPDPKVINMLEYFDNQKARIDSILWNFQKMDTLDKASTVIKIQSLNTKFENLQTNVTKLNGLLGNHPERFVEISSFKKDLDNIEREIEILSETNRREIDRISSYNNTLIAFMITFLVAFVSIGGFNFFAAKRKSTDQ